MKDLFNEYESTKEDFNSAVSSEDIPTLTDAYADYVEKYTALASLVNGASGSQTVSFEVALLSGTATGLANTAAEYTTTVRLGTDSSDNVTVTIVGSTAQTFGTLATELEGQLTGVTVSLVGNQVVMTLDAVGSTVELFITDVEGDDLWSSLNDFAEVNHPVRGRAAYTSTDATVTAYMGALATEKAAYDTTYDEIINPPEEE